MVEAYLSYLCSATNFGSDLDSAASAYLGASSFNNRANFDYHIISDHDTAGLPLCQVGGAGANMCSFVNKTSPTDQYASKGRLES